MFHSELLTSKTSKCCRGSDKRDKRNMHENRGLLFQNSTALHVLDKWFIMVCLVPLHST